MRQGFGYAASIAQFEKVRPLFFFWGGGGGGRQKSSKMGTQGHSYRTSYTSNKYQQHLNHMNDLIFYMKNLFYRPQLGI